MTRDWANAAGTAAAPNYQAIPMSRGRGVDPSSNGGGAEYGANGEKMFHKPRALSRQTDANIRIEVHRDETIINHLQRE